MVLPILTHPHPLLRQKAEKIKDAKDPQIKELVLDMLETLKDIKGLGLAAPQVGKSVRLCMVKIDGKAHILINPEITSKSIRKDILEEGCFSLPGKFLPVKRHKKIKVKALNRKGDKIVLKADGMLARAIQHEMDHLDGVLIIDREERIKL